MLAAQTLLPTLPVSAPPVAPAEQAVSWLPYLLVARRDPSLVLKPVVIREAA